jgi:predicted ABC-type ATPase
LKLKKPPLLSALLQRAEADADARPLAFVVAGHNGSGKSTLWYERMAPVLQRPLINADRLIMSILPAPEDGGHLVSWAARMRDEDERWQKLAQAGVVAFQRLVTEQKMSFALETVFSYWQPQPDGTVKSKIDVIENLRKDGYFVVLLFVGLANVEISIARVRQRKERGGHDVEKSKLRDRFPRTQQAIGQAALVADMTIMFDNSLTADKAFQVTRVQRKKDVLFDCRDTTYDVPHDLRVASTPWLDQVVGQTA